MRYLFKWFVVGVLGLALIVQAQEIDLVSEAELSQLVVNETHDQTPINVWQAIVEQARFEADQPISAWHESLGLDEWVKLDLANELTSLSRLYETEGSPLNAYPVEIELIFYQEHLFYIGLNYLAAYIPLEYTTDSQTIDELNHVSDLSENAVSTTSVTYIKDPTLGDQIIWAIPINNESEDKVELEIIQQNDSSLSSLATSSIDFAANQYSNYLIDLLMEEELLSLDIGPLLTSSGYIVDDTSNDETTASITIKPPSNWSEFLSRNLKEINIAEEQPHDGKKMIEAFEQFHQLEFNSDEEEVSLEGNTTEALDFLAEIDNEIKNRQEITKENIMDIFGPESHANQVSNSEFLTYYGVDDNHLVILEFHFYQNQLIGYLYLNKDSRLYESLHLNEEEVAKLDKQEALTLNDVTARLGLPQSIAVQLPNQTLYSWISIQEDGNFVITANSRNNGKIELTYQTISIEN
ncbi:hypothetical protein ACTQ54_04005 [Fundicoccus sp. Sow4_H7]|uniref:hypothetical protein n=1 Tax=Fundicoccus sp. Sow4_H7 TaxID=3438784 RepID=UPI003F90EEA1